MNLSDAEARMVREAISESQNALLDYVARLEKQGCIMGYGNHVMRGNSAAIAMLDAKAGEDDDTPRLRAIYAAGKPSQGEGM